jgi:hypothetical protein
MTSKKGMSVILATALGMALSCARGAEKEPNVSGDDETTRNAASSKASGEVCMDRACSVNDECCAGYVCTFDPSLSHVQRYCLSEN